jgi:hypothetical protein
VTQRETLRHLFLNEDPILLARQCWSPWEDNHDLMQRLLGRLDQPQASRLGGATTRLIHKRDIFDGVADLETEARLNPLASSVAVVPLMNGNTFRFGRS